MARPHIVATLSLDHDLYQDEVYKLIYYSGIARPSLSFPAIHDYILPAMADFERRAGTADPWFPDRRLILAAGSELFRVHLSVLLPRIAIPKLLRSAQRDAVLEAAYEGNVALRLNDDPQDLRHYLLAVYNEGYVPFSPPRRQLWFEKVAGVLRIAHKYRDQELRQRALLIFCEALAFAVTPDGVGFSVCAENSDLIEDRDLEAACVLAHEVGAFWLLPPIYLRILGNSARFEQVEHHGRARKLQPRFAADLKEARDRMIASLMFKLTWCLPRQCIECYDWCTRGVRFYFAEYQLNGLFNAAIAISRQDNDVRRLFERYFAVCDRCTTHIMDIFNSWAEEQWRELPSMFGLPTDQVSGTAEV
ncbi:uncharacterized protein SCHCODRAFT_02221977 [Schizophyllum commune H4-8]|uniref:uncharacterized protein n=1 Tax=Schizophyllum commune (strain H4-8 / FGSC 9210) TaxID=578458 RepID=UPI00215FE3A8|nr:uncharacterized protein SCHCODRAFT_02221977 [Schizophyllum commune H4-8]KAI5895046.1 hypothetical protein SCHCODRAFT_02221977 [Schizophyllum commune H4-8]